MEVYNAILRSTGGIVERLLAPRGTVRTLHYDARTALTRGWFFHAGIPAM